MLSSFKKIKFFAMFMVILFVVSLGPVAMADELALDEAYQRDRAIYQNYLINGGFDKIIGYNGHIFDSEYNYQYELEYDENDYEIESCMIDLNNDGRYELLISLTDVEGAAWFAPPNTTAFLGIQGNEVKIFAYGYISGGSIGGDSLKIKYDTVSKEHVLVLSGFTRIGNNHIYDYFDEYASYGDMFFEYMKTCKQRILIGEHSDEYHIGLAEEIKSETSLYYYDEDYFFCYEVDGEYVTQEVYYDILDRFIDPIDNSYEMQLASFDMPIPHNSFTILGDLNGDERITASDARIALRISARLETAKDWQIRAGDVDLNGKVTAVDARHILRASARLESPVAWPAYRR